MISSRIWRDRLGASSRPCARDAAQLVEIAVDSVLVEAVRQAAEANSYFFAGRRCHFSCGAGRQFLTVSVNGGIYPCPRFVACPEHKIGSIYETTLRNEIHKKSLLYNADGCPRCWARYYCGGGCVSQHMGATGSIFKVNPETCRWRKGKFEQAIRVIASLTRTTCVFSQNTAWSATGRSFA